MSESFLERLSRFTPTAGGLDRDALLFAAGRGSARPDRRWKALASALAATQVLSLALLLPHSSRPAWDPSQRADAPAPAEVARNAGQDAPRSPGVWSIRHELTDSEAAERFTATGSLIEDEPPLRAFGSPPPSMLY